MRAKEAGPSSSNQEPPVKLPCTHSRMLEDERTPDGKNSGRVVCMECGTVLPTAVPPNISTD